MAVFLGSYSSSFLLSLFVLRFDVVVTTSSRVVERFIRSCNPFQDATWITFLPGFHRLVSVFSPSLISPASHWLFLARQPHITRTIGHEDSAKYSTEFGSSNEAGTASPHASLTIDTLYHRHDDQMTNNQNNKMSYSRFHSLHPRTSLRRLKTALTPLSPSSPTPSTASTTSTSPLSTTTRASSNFSGFNFDFLNTSAVSLSSSPRPQTAGRAIRRKKSMVEVEQEEERDVFNGQLVGLVEPRPRAGVSLGGIEEVLEGRV